MNKKLSILSEVSLRTGVLLVGIYYCIFSMLFSAGIILAFAVSVVLYRLYLALRIKQKFGQRIKTFIMDLLINYNIVVIIILGMGIAMILELQSGRSNANWETIYKGSLLSVAFINRIISAASGFIGYIRLVNKYIMLVCFFLLLFAAIYFIKQKNRMNIIIDQIAKIMISMIFLIVFYILVAAKGGIDRIGNNYCTYGVFFYGVLLISLVSLYILQEIKISHIFYPFLLTMMILIVFNSTRWPYEISDNGENAKLTNQVISAINEASERNDTVITLYVPEEYNLPHWAVTRLSHTLYYHNVTMRKIRVLDIISSPEVEKAYYKKESL